MVKTSISVVIPLYNKRTTIGRSIESVLDQLCDEDELIVVDDGSTDGSSDLVEYYSSKSTFIRLIKQINLGVSAARNTGIRAAQNEYVVLLDADDWWLNGVRKKLAELISRWPGAQAWSVGHYRVDGTRRLYVNPGIKVDTLMDGLTFIDNYGKYSGTINSSTVCLTKAAFSSSGGFPEGAATGEDIYLWLRLGLQGAVGVSPSPLVCIDRSLSGGPKKHYGDMVGYHYQFFADPRNLAPLGVDGRAAVKRFLVRNGLRQIAGYVAVGERRWGWQKAKAVGRVVRWFPLVAAVVLASPSGVWQWAFRRRHRIST